MAAATYDDAGCRLVRNHGPFPFIQSEGGFVEQPERRNKNFVEKPSLPTEPQEPSPCAGVVLSDYQLEAIIRLRQQLDLQRTPLEPLTTRHKRTAAEPQSHLPDQDASHEDKSHRKSVADAKGPRQSSANAKGPRQSSAVARGPHQEEKRRQTQETVDPFTSPAWSAKMSPWDRLAAHQTLSSIRNHALMYRPFVIQSDLEFVLNSVFDQSQTLWADCAGVVVQPETAGIPTWKVLRNTRPLKPGEVISESPYGPKTPPPGAPGGPIGAPLYGGPQTSLGARQARASVQSGASGVSGVPRSSGASGAGGVPTTETAQYRTSLTPSQVDLDHPLRHGGITEKLSPYSVKLAISGNHVSQTNDGYSRKVDGTFFS